MTMVIAIDGPAASGKSTVARKLAEKLPCTCLNSGILYRALTWQILHSGIDPADQEAITFAVSRMQLELSVPPIGSPALQIDHHVPEFESHDNEVNAAVSKVATVPAVRSCITSLLRGFGKDRDVVMEGRDIGTAVFPDTPYKFYLDASPEIRRQRRAAQGLEDSIENRDRLDSTRSIAPLSIASDAHVIDTSNLTIDGVVDAIFEILTHASRDQQ
jgi:CMP/dCMP kinase